MQRRMTKVETGTRHNDKDQFNSRGVFVHITLFEVMGHDRHEEFLE